MNAVEYLRIAPFLNDCPKCGYGHVGTDDKTGEFHGALIVDNNLFTRKCRCGFEVTVDSGKGTTKRVIKEQISNSLARFEQKS